MRHGEIAPVAPVGKTGVGLSVATLGKLLKAPRLLYPNQLEEDVKEAEKARQMELFSQHSHGISSGSNSPVKPHQVLLRYMYIVFSC